MTFHDSGNVRPWDILASNGRKEMNARTEEGPDVGRNGCQTEMFCGDGRRIIHFAVFNWTGAGDDEDMELQIMIRLGNPNGASRKVPQDRYF